MDEQAYRGNNHPPYCSCVECTRRRSQRRQSPLARVRRLGCMPTLLIAAGALIATAVTVATLL